MADKLATMAVNEENCKEPEWHPSFGTMLKIAGKMITRKEGLQLGIAAEISDLHKWQREKLDMTHAEYRKIDWPTQHAAMAKLPRRMHRFAV